MSILWLLCAMSSDLSSAFKNESARFTMLVLAVRHHLAINPEAQTFSFSFKPQANGELSVLVSNPTELNGVKTRAFQTSVGYTVQSTIPVNWRSRDRKSSIYVDLVINAISNLTSGGTDEAKVWWKSNDKEFFLAIEKLPSGPGSDRAIWMKMDGTVITKLDGK